VARGSVPWARSTTANVQAVSMSWPGLRPALPGHRPADRSGGAARRDDAIPGELAALEDEIGDCNHKLA
jgi:hypothetical protein